MWLWGSISFVFVTTDVPKIRNTTEPNTNAVTEDVAATIGVSESGFERSVMDKTSCLMPRVNMNAHFELTASL